MNISDIKVKLSLDTEQLESQIRTLFDNFELKEEVKELKRSLLCLYNNSEIRPSKLTEDVLNAISLCKLLESEEE